MRRDLAAIGLDVRVENLPLGEMFARLGRPGGAWDLGYFPWYSDNADGPTSSSACSHRVRASVASAMCGSSAASALRCASAGPTAPAPSRARRRAGAQRRGPAVRPRCDHRLLLRSHRLPGPPADLRHLARRAVRPALRAAPRLPPSMPDDTLPASADDVAAGLRSVGYLPGESTALVAYLAARLGKPVLVEGPAGVGKTELAKALAAYLGRSLVRLQCYEGLDEAKALYEWNYRKQLLRIQAEAAGHGLGRGPGRHLRRGVPARPAAAHRHRLRAAGRAADRRDRQDRPGVRGDAARAPVRLPDLHPRARAASRRAPIPSCCSPRTTRAS